MFALVTGATGFIGSHLVDELLEQGWKVRIIIRESSDLRWLPEDRIEIMRGALTDPEAIRKAVEGVEYIFHVAGQYRAPTLDDYRSVNVVPTRLLLEAASENPHFRRFVLVSSFGACGPSPDGVPLTETTACRPVSNYGMSKLEAEQVTLSYSERVPVTIIRPPAVYGPRDENFIVVFRHAKKGIVPKIGAADRFTSMIYVRDLAKGMILAATSEQAKGEVYFMAAESYTGNVEFVKEVARVLGVRVRRVVVPRFLFSLAALIVGLKKSLTGKVGFINEDRLATLQQRYWIASVDKMKRDLQWVPPTSLRNGLETTAKWYRENGWV